MASGNQHGFRAVRARRTVGRKRWARPLAEVLESRQLLAVITVNTTGDADGADGGSTLSLRQAIEVSDGTLAVSSLTASQAAQVSGALTSPNLINFDIPGTGPFTIKPTTPLPAISAPLDINGYSQPGALANSNAVGQADNAILMIGLNGSATYGAGLQFTAPSSLVEGLAIGGFSVCGVALDDTSSTAGDEVFGDFIGTDTTGTIPLPNNTGVESQTGPNQIGSTAPFDFNVISGNGFSGIELFASSNLVVGNYIGTDPTGTKALPNGHNNGDGGGIEFIGGTHNTIGGTASGSANVISGNLSSGIEIFENEIDNGSIIPQQFPGDDNLIQGNLIGTDLTGTLPLGNAFDGILINDGNSNTIGGTALSDRNVIAFNGQSGVAIATVGANVFFAFSNQFNLISGNSIYGNGGLGIDLGADGVTPNNPAGAVQGPNRLQPYPVLTSVTNGSVISGTLDAASSTSYTVELFANPTADPSGFGQGQTYLGSTVATTDASGHASFSFTSAFNLGGQAISATATDPQGNTSEFARDFTTQAATTTTLIGPSTTTYLGQPATFAAVVTSKGSITPTGFVAFTSNGVFLGVAPVNASGIAVFITQGLPLGVNGVLAYYLSDASNLPSVSNVALLYVNPTGPTVTSAAFSGSHSVKVTFSRPLLLKPAQDRANYTIIAPNGRALTTKSAVYSSSGDSVTVTTSQALNRNQTYQLIVNGVRVGRVVDINRIPLSGNPDGQPGTSFIGKITPNGLVAVSFHAKA